MTEGGENKDTQFFGSGRGRDDYSLILIGSIRQLLRIPFFYWRATFDSSKGLGRSNDAKITPVDS